MATNEILPFCPTDSGTNLLTQSEYAAASTRTAGVSAGVASSKLNNKSIRQPTFVASQYAQFISDLTGADVLDNGVTAQLLATINMAQKPQVPVYQKFTTGSGTYNRSYYFGIATGSATAGATYTNNGVTYTVITTVASGTQILMRGSGAPTASGTLTKSGGTGDATLTFYAYKVPLYLRIRAVAGGGGGGGSGTSGGTGGTGGNTTFGSSLITCNGGLGGTDSGSGLGGVGGTATIGTGADGTAVSGSIGGASGVGSALQAGGGGGGPSPWGGVGSGGLNNAGRAAIANTGSGGGGAGSSSTNGGGGGGGGGGYIDAIVSSPAATYAYAIGTGGTAGTAGGSGFVGGAGASGYIEVIEHWQ